MTDTIFRTKTESTAESETLPVTTETTRGSEINIEVPYMDYTNEHNHSYLVDHYTIGDGWEDPVGGFPKEVALIDGYIQGKIKDGEIANNIEDVKNLLKTMEKTNNLTKESRLVVKLEVLANYVEFLMKNEHLKYNLRRYANT